MLFVGAPMSIAAWYVDAPAAGAFLYPNPQVIVVYPWCWPRKHFAGIVGYEFFVVYART